MTRTIHCDDLDQFLDAIAGLVARGLGFTSDAGTFTITLTGGH